ncbi:MAG: hypothetical protein R3E69_00945 [Steroidobacteraceae bacterium]
MQTLAAYLLDRPGLAIESSAALATSVGSQVDAWLKEKGASAPAADTGCFPSLTQGAEGTYRRRRYRGEKSVLEEIRLEEPSRDGQKFTTSLYVAASSTRIMVYATLDVVNVESIVAPARTDPRCPAIVRRLLGLIPDWELNGTPISSIGPRAVYDQAGAEDLVRDIKSSGRSIPIVVVSELEDETIFPDLAEKVSYDLSGLAQIIRVNDLASWTLTRELGKENSCYKGAVRIYWPMRRFQAEEFEIPSTVWTPSRILSGDRDGKGNFRFREALRRSVMSVAALALEMPSAIAEIQRYESRLKLHELEQKTTSQSQELELAKLYEADNARLVAELAEAKQANARLLSRVEAAEHALSQRKDSPDNDLDSASTPGGDDPGTPEAGETRYYKKTHSKQSHDVLVRVQDCGHTTWQSATKADKAKKGVERLEGSSDWKNIQHCGSCTGGGMWKVRW